MPRSRPFACILSSPKLLCNVGRKLGALLILMLVFSSAKSQLLESTAPQKHYKKDPLIVIQVEKYLAASFYRNNYWDSLLVSYTGPDQFSKFLEGKLLDYFTPKQRALFHDAHKNGADVQALFNAFESIEKSNLDSLVSLYSENPRQLVPKKNIVDDNGELPMPEQPTYCENMDFEDGDFSNWEIANGKVNNVPYGFVSRVVTATYGNGIPVDDGLQHNIINAGQTDPIVPIEAIKPGGTVSACLGDLMGDGYRAASMRRSFEVTADNYFFSYSYAVVMEDPTNAHTAGERPYFTVRMWDGNGDQLDCSEYEVYAGDGKPVWQNNAGSPTGVPIVYTDWTDAFIPLQNYIGQEITIEFAVGDCNLGGHAAYAYVEANCGGEIEVTDTFACPGVPVTLTAPGGAKSYLWSTGETTQSIQVADSGLFGVLMEATAGGGCVVALTKRIHLKSLPLSDFSADTVCFGQATNFRDKSVSATTGFVDWQWDHDNDGNFDGSGEDYQHVFDQAGLHTVKLKVEDNNGCLHDTLFEVLVREKPVVDFVANDTCELKEHVLTNTSDKTGVVFSEWQWDISVNGSIDYTTENTKHTFPADGLDSILLIGITEHGCADSSVHQLTTHPLPTASFVVKDVCLNDSTVVEEKSAGSVVLFEWDFDGDRNMDSNKENPKWVFQDAGDHNVFMRVTSDFGCLDSFETAATVIPLPKADFEFREYCYPFPSEFSNLSTAINASLLTYKWDFGDTLGMSIETNPTYSYAAYGQHDVQLRVESAEGCLDSITKTIEVFEKPTAAFEVNDTCLHAPLSFRDASFSASSKIAEWSWDMTEDQLEDYATKNASHAFHTNGNRDVRLIVTTEDGCKDTVVNLAHVIPLPVADFEVSNVCFGDSTLVRDRSTADEGRIVQWTWDFGNNLSGEDSVQQVLFATEGLYGIELIVNTNSNCKDTLSKPAEVYPLPIADFSPTEVCLNEPTIFYDQSMVSNLFTENKIIAYTWEFVPGGPVIGSDSMSYSYSSEGQYDVALQVETDRGCMDSVQKTVVVHPLPVIDMNSSLPQGCTEWCIDFADSSLIATGSLSSFNWDFGNGEVSSQKAPSMCFVNEEQEPVYYTVNLNVVSDKGCESDATFLDYVTVYPRAIADFDYDPKDKVTEAQALFSFENNSFGDFWMWDFGDGSIDSVHSPVYQYENSGEYLVSLMANNQYDCPDSTSKSLEVLPTFAYYAPNAVTADGDGLNDVFYIYGYNITDFEMYIFDRWGLKLFESKSMQDGWDATYLGRPVQEDVYVYKAYLTDVFGGKHTLTGLVTVVK